MKYLLFCLVFLPLIVSGQLSNNMTFLSNFDLPNLPVRYGASYNDCWGFKHPTNGTEVAIIGGIEDIFFINVTNPAAPVLIYTHHVLNADGTTNQSLWRDFKTYQNYLYACADEGDSGLLIFNLNNVPSSVSLVTQHSLFWNRAHNIFIDGPNSRLYAAGANSQISGLRILDLSTTPLNPTLLASVSLTALGGGYVHDVYVKNNVAYCSHGGLHKLQMYNMANLSNITLVGVVENYPESGYNHSSWLNDAGTKLVMADETQGSDLKLVDVTDPLNISLDDIKTFYSELLGPAAPGASIAHNPFIKGDLAYIAYYHDGVQVFDISNPDTIQRIAFYDTYPINTGYAGYEGCWGVYPFLPSGIILASDQTYGLYVLQITNLALGVDFLAFDATRRSNGVQLSWSIADATFGNRFEIKRSSDNGQTFETIGTVALLESENKYFYTDLTAQTDQHYLYRIDFVELDGNRVKSPIRNITAGESKKTIVVANPMSTQLVINVLNPIELLEVTIYDMEGKVVWSFKENAPRARMEKEIPALISGHYIMSATWPGGYESLLLQIIPGDE